MREHSTKPPLDALFLTSDYLECLILVRGVEHYASGFDTGNFSEKPVMVHGWAGSAKYWKSTANALADQFDCLLYE